MLRLSEKLTDDPVQPLKWMVTLEDAAKKFLGRLTWAIQIYPERKVVTILFMRVDKYPRTSSIVSLTREDT